MWCHWFGEEALCHLTQFLTNIFLLVTDSGFKKILYSGWHIRVISLVILPSMRKIIWASWPESWLATSWADSRMNPKMLNYVTFPLKFLLWYQCGAVPYSLRLMLNCHTCCPAVFCPRCICSEYVGLSHVCTKKTVKKFILQSQDLQSKEGTELGCLHNVSYPALWCKSEVGKKVVLRWFLKSSACM